MKETKQNVGRKSQGEWKLFHYNLPPPIHRKMKLYLNDWMTQHLQELLEKEAKEYERTKRHKWIYSNTE